MHHGNAINPSIHGYVYIKSITEKLEFFFLNQKAALRMALGSSLVLTCQSLTRKVTFESGKFFSESIIPFSRANLVMSGGNGKDL